MVQCGRDIKGIIYDTMWQAERRRLGEHLLLGREGIQFLKAFLQVFMMYEPGKPQEKRKEEDKSQLHTVRKPPGVQSWCRIT